MKVEVNRDACIGCGACAAICDDVFEIDYEGLSEVKDGEISDDLKDAVCEARDACPTEAISVQ